MRHAHCYLEATHWLFLNLSSHTQLLRAFGHYLHIHLAFSTSLLLLPSKFQFILYDGFFNFYYKLREPLIPLGRTIAVCF